MTDFLDWGMVVVTTWNAGVWVYRLFAAREEREDAAVR